ncbi:DUF6401 family natural product biosynthesis protein [Actinomadura atramentaria]|uniref:DUF6401 family natural product biosynthesis protein n=1 Tax=Actinomadura atramentaria TaxID=1990 RepID=UPI0003A93533|nr:DUF6401 family natural product biosynthesis protein [Actinomadura atramentaria]
MSAELAVLVRDIGDAGVAEMSTTPGLAAAVDQHVAELRATLEATGSDELMAYLCRYAEEAFNRGWWPESTRDYEFVRIVAVCWLLRENERAA